MTYILAILIPIVAGWSIAASEALFRAEDRPQILRGNAGTIRLLVFNAFGGLLMAGAIVWVFLTIVTSAVLVLIAAGGLIGAAASRRLHVNGAGAANRLIVGVVGLLILYSVAWSLYPPR
jgi:hypothetical protein